MALTKDQILAADDAKRELVPVEEWDGEVWVGAMTAADLSHYEASLITVNDKGKVTGINLDGSDVRHAALAWIVQAKRPELLVRATQWPSCLRSSV